MDKKTMASLIFTYQKSIVNNYNLKIVGNKFFSFTKGEFKILKKFIEENNITSYEFFIKSINQGFPLLEYEDKNYRIEPGAIIRKNVHLGDNCVILMNSTINIGASIGENTMIDMNAVIGSSAQIGKNCHIGAGVVVAGVMEPESNKPVIIEDNVFIGANSVILEGVKIGSNSIVGAMSLVNKDIPSNSLVMGVPGKVIKNVDERLLKKCMINSKLR